MENKKKHSTLFLGFHWNDRADVKLGWNGHLGWETQKYQKYLLDTVQTLQIKQVRKRSSSCPHEKAQHSGNPRLNLLNTWNHTYHPQEEGLKVLSPLVLSESTPLRIHANSEEQPKLQADVIGESGINSSTECRPLGPLHGVDNIGHGTDNSF